MEKLNLYFAWCWILAGLLFGAVLGLRFHDEHWLGGYGSWRRRLLRLGHVAFFGTSLLNLGFAFTVRHLVLRDPFLVPASALLIVGAVTMPVICALAAWRERWRRLFPVPVLSLVLGAALFLLAMLPGLVVWRP